MSDAGGNFISEKFKEWCAKLKREQAPSSLYYHQRNEKVEACIKFLKHTLRRCVDTNAGPHIALLQIRSISLEQGLPSPGTLSFDQPKRSIMSILNRPLINTNNTDDHYKTLVKWQTEGGKIYDTLRNFYSISIGYTVVVQSDDGALRMHGAIIKDTTTIMTDHTKHVPYRSGIQKQKNRQTRGHSKTVWKPNTVKQRLDLYWSQD